MQQDARIGPNNMGGNAHRVERGSVALADVVLFSPKLDQQVKNSATPDASDRRSDKSRQVGLSNQTKTWATPANHDGTTGTKVNSPFKSLVGDVEKITPLTQGKLNPRWVETLMGLPVGWTMPSCASPVTIERMNSDCSGMESFRQQPKGRSEH
jgi:hypothetical protein